MSLRDLILAAKPPEPVKCHPPDWPEPVWVRAWSSLERETFQQDWRNWRTIRSMGDDDFRTFDAFMVRHVVQDAEGNLIFADADVLKLAETSGRSIDYVVEIARKLNGIDAADIAELVKNSVASRTSPSGSGSDKKTV